MSTAYIDNYLSDTVDLMATMCIKSTATAGLINDLLIAKYGPTSVDLNNLTTWTYYLNVSGKPGYMQPGYGVIGQIGYGGPNISIISLDTQLPMDFTVSNLASNPITNKAYQYGSKYYIALAAKYPTLEHYIKGVLYPVDINKAIAADNHTILAYSISLVEPQEITLIAKLNAWLKTYQNRWDIPPFNITDSLYQVAQLGLLFQHLVLKILNLRLKACKTNEAHSFHITQYLASHQGLDVYIPYMTQQQKLYLYRNIAYLEHNQGSADTLDILIKNLLTNRNIPIANLDIVLNNTFDSLAYPSIVFKETNINTVTNNNSTTTLSYGQMLSKLDNLTTGNSEYHTNKHDAILNRMQLSRESELKTKMLDSSMIDYTDCVRYPLQTSIVNLWPYLAFKDVYTATLTIVDPTTAIPYLLTALDAYVLMWYCLTKSVGIDPIAIPEFIATRVPKAIKPSQTNLLSLCDSHYVNASAVADSILTNAPAFPNSITTNSAFYNVANQYFQASVNEWLLASRTEDIFFSSQVDNMCEYLYEDIGLGNVDTGTNYNDWLIARQIDFSHYINQTQFNNMATAILKVATGISNITITPIAQVQNAMVGILKTLSSYSINFITEINTTPIVLTNFEALRYSSLGDSTSDLEMVDTTLNLDVTTDHTTSASNMFSINGIVSMTSDFAIDKAISVETTLFFSSTNKYVSDAVVDVFDLTTQYTQQPTPFTDFTSLTTAQQLAVPDIYSPII